MNITNRIFWSDNGTLKDLSSVLGEYASSTQVLPIVAAQDKLFIGAEVPFNHRYFSVKVPNALASVLSVELWNGNAWVAVGNTVDESSVAGSTWNISGHLIFIPNEDVSLWGRADTKQMTGSGLETLNINRMYWVKLSFSGDLTPAAELRYIGWKFANDNDVKLLYPDLVRSEVFAQFQAGKTSWEEQHLFAAEMMIRDLRQKRAIWSPNQLLDSSLLKEAGVHKLAEIVFNAFGQDYVDSRKVAHNYYKDALAQISYRADENATATLDTRELGPQVGFLSR